MKVELDTTDLLNLLNGTPPSFNLQQTDKILELGRYSLTFKRWIWNSKLKTMSQRSLFALYNECKNTK